MKRGLIFTLSLLFLLASVGTFVVPRLVYALSCFEYPAGEVIENTSITQVSNSLNAAQTTLTITTVYNPEQYCAAGHQWKWYWSAGHNVQDSRAVPQLTQSTPVDTGSVQTGTKTYQTQVDVSDLPNGTYDINHTAHRNLGFNDTDSSQFTINNRPAPTPNPPTVTLSANPQNDIPNGGSTTLTWTVSGNATSCTASGAWSGAKAAGNGSHNETRSNLTAETYTYTITCTNAGGNDTDSVTVNVQNPNEPELQGSCSVSPSTPTTGQQVTWSATAFSGTGSYTYSWTGTDSLSGTTQSVNKTYATAGTKSATVTITSGSQSIQKSCNVTVSQTPPPAPGTCDITVQSQGLPTRWDLTGPGGTESQTTNTYGPVTYSDMEAGTYTLVASQFAGYYRTIDPMSSAVCSAGSNLDFVITYSQQQRTLIVDVDNGTGSGSVTSVPTGITCGTGPNDCQQNYANGTSVTLTASSSAGSTFFGWDGGGCSGTGATCTVTMNNDRTVKAIFNTQPSPPGTYTLTVSKLGTGSGTVTGTGINCGMDCSETYNTVTSVTLTPTPGTGSVFAGWSGHADCSDGQVTMNADKTCRATFTTEACGPGGGCPGGCTNPPDPQCGPGPGPGGGALSCAVTSPVPASTHQQITFEATGGVSPYKWDSPAGCVPMEGDDNTFQASCNNVGTYVFTVTDSQADLDGPETAECEVQVIAQCSDGEDNEPDGFTDFSGGDPGCDSPEDPNEFNTVPQCRDGVNNDPAEDSLIDFSGGDPGCESEDDNDERDPVVVECSDGFDNDGDGFTDFAGGDPGCSSALDNSETRQEIEEF